MGDGLKRAFAAAVATRESEKDVQRKVYELCVKCDCAVYWMSQARETQQTPGVPDLLVFSPLRGFAFIECKSPNGRQSREQRAFEDYCFDAGVTYILAPSVEPVRDWLGRRENLR